jgi:hypothetical protein
MAVFVVPSKSGVVGSVVNMTVATLPGNLADWRVAVAAPVGQMGTLGPKIIRTGVDMAKLPGLRDGYEIWQGSVDLGQSSTGAISVYVSTGRLIVDTLMLDAGVAGW